MARPAELIALVAFAVAAVLAPRPAIGGDKTVVRVIVHPKRADAITEAEARAIYLKQRLFWTDGSAIVAINREAGSDARELFSSRLFGQGSQRLAGYWNQRYFEAGEFPPATLASDDAILRFVAGNENAIGYVLLEDPGPSVAVALELR